MTDEIAVADADAPGAEARGLRQIVELLRRHATREALVAAQAALRRHVEAGGNVAACRGLEALLGYRLGEIDGEALAEALAAGGAEGAYPPYNVLAFVGEYLPETHGPAMRRLLFAAARQSPAVARTAVQWARPDERGLAYGILLAHLKRTGAEPADALALLRLAHRISAPAFGATFEALWRMAPLEDPASEGIVEALGLALLEAGAHGSDLARLLIGARVGLALREAGAPGAELAHLIDPPRAVAPSRALAFVCAHIDMRSARLSEARAAFAALADDPRYGAAAAAMVERVDLVLLMRRFERLSPVSQRAALEETLAAALGHAGRGATLPSLTEALAFVGVSGEVRGALEGLRALFAHHGRTGAPPIVSAVAARLGADLAGPREGAGAWLVGGMETRVAAVRAALKRAGRGVAAYMLESLVGPPDGAEDPAAALNFYFDAVGIGERTTAAGALAGVSRVYAAALRAVDWPSDANGVPWPHFALAPASADPGALPRISIVVPSFNQRRYVEETILSIVNQGYANLEIIVFDAVSTDGTQDVLKRHAACFDVLVIEPDAGQSDAINKGMQRATGELLYWLNTDDMLAPGALHAIAETYLASGADLVAGYAVETANRVMLLLNLPQAEEADFTPEALTDLFGRWLRGHFFYQPEVFFTRAIWERAGAGLRLDTNYTMDFDFWLRCARLGARYQRVRAPVAFFRKHAEQKTDALTDCIDEQAGLIREAGYNRTAPARRAAVAALTRRFAADGRSVAVVSRRHDKIFAADMDAELARSETRFAVNFHARADAFDPAGVDLVIHLCHLLDDPGDVAFYREHGFAGPVVGWFWDNHHTYFANAEAARVLDLVCPSHVLHAEYLKGREIALIDPVPLCVTQWTRHSAAALYGRWGAGRRDERLYGGFVRYAIGGKRNDLVLDLLAEPVPSALYLLEESDLKPYFGRTAADRFAEWCGYKASLCLPLRTDLSQRFFDAWLTGQIPVVPAELVPTLAFLGEDALARHTAVFADYTAEAVRAAHAEAIAKFDAGGQAGADARHALARDHHMFESRIAEIIDKVLAFA